jgi:hypothetical protein
MRMSCPINAIRGDLTTGMPSFLCDPIKFPRLSCKGILLVTISAVKFNLL